MFAQQRNEESHGRPPSQSVAIVARPSRRPVRDPAAAMSRTQPPCSQAVRRASRPCPIALRQPYSGELRASNRIGRNRPPRRERTTSSNEFNFEPFAREEARKQRTSPLRSSHRSSRSAPLAPCERCGGGRRGAAGRHRRRGSNATTPRESRHSRPSGTRATHPRRRQRSQNGLCRPCALTYHAST